METLLGRLKTSSGTYIVVEKKLWIVQVKVCFGDSFCIWKFERADKLRRKCCEFEAPTWAYSALKWAKIETASAKGLTAALKTWWKIRSCSGFCPGKLSPPPTPSIYYVVVESHVQYFLPSLHNGKHPDLWIARTEALSPSFISWILGKIAENMLAMMRVSTRAKWKNNVVSIFLPWIWFISAGTFWTWSVI